jgi:hypothetical protein
VLLVLQLFFSGSPDSANGGLCFILPNNQTLIIEHLNQLLVHNPDIISREDYVKVSWIPSILRLDILNRYKLSTQDAYITLER